LLIKDVILTDQAKLWTLVYDDKNWFKFLFWW
jgi:hypothetical protein